MNDAYPEEYRKMLYFWAWNNWKKALFLTVDSSVLRE